MMTLKGGNYIRLSAFKTGGESEAHVDDRAPVSRIFFWAELFAELHYQRVCDTHQAAPSASFFPLPFILLIIPFLPDVFLWSNSRRQRRPRFRVVNTSFICLGQNINMGVGEQSCCVHHCRSCNCCDGSWCCILLDGYRMIASRVSDDETIQLTE